MGADRKRSGAFAENGDVPRISAECGDIVVHPLKSGELIEQAIVAGGVMSGLCRQFWMHEKTEDAEAVVHRYDNDALLREIVTVLARLRGGAGHEASTINPNHDGEFRIDMFVGNPDIQGEAVLAAARIMKHHVTEDVSLQAVGTEFRCLLHAGPLRGGNRRLPAQIADRWRGVPHAEEGFHLAIVLALDGTQAGLHLRGGRTCE